MTTTTTTTNHAPTTEELTIEGFWVDPQLALPKHKPDQPDSVDVLCYVRTGQIYRFTVGMYNYIRQEWFTDIGRYSTEVQVWAYVPKVTKENT